MVLLHAFQEHMTNKGAPPSKKEALVHGNDNSEMEVARSPFAATVDNLFAAGFVAIPIWPRDKLPAEYAGGRWTPMSGWNDFSHRRPEPALVDRWRTWPDAGIGIVLGTNVGNLQLVALDFDTDDQDELDKLQSMIPPSRMIKQGSRGYTAFYRASKATRTKRYMVPAPTAEKPNAKRTVLEILTGNAPRQTVMPPSIHPHGMAYRYLTGNAIVPIAQLPVLTDDHFEQLEDTLEGMGWDGASGEEPRRERERSAGGDRDDPNIWRHTNDVALEKLHMWVGELGLPKLREHRNGRWEAVPTWRASGTGRSTMERKPNLSFHRSGIKDLGTDVGYTPLDVVSATFGWDFDTCFSWLRDKIGLTDDSDIFEVRQLIEAADGTVSDAKTGEIIPPLPANENSTGREDDEFPDNLTRPDGVLGEMVDYICDTASRPNRTLALASALVALGTLIGRRDASPTGSGTHLYVLALAPTGYGKQHPQDAGEMLVTVASRDSRLKIVGAPDFMSHTALVRQVIDQPLSLSFIDEFGIYLKKINSPKASAHEDGMKKVLLAAWGKSFTSYRTPAWANQKSETIESPALSIFGGSTQKVFYDALQGDDRENGFLNRFLLMPTKLKIASRKPLYDFRDVPIQLVERLEAIYNIRRPAPIEEVDQFGKPIRPQHPSDPEMHVSCWGNGAEAVFSCFRDECEDREPNAFFVRTAEMAVRLATIVAVGRNAEFPTVSIKDLKWGMAVSLWSSERMAKDAGLFVSDTEIGKDRARIMSKVQGTPGKRCKQSTVLRDLGLSAETLQKLVRDLVEIGDLLPVEIVKPASGGKEVRYLRAA